jgi:UDP-glucuronate 4-epimerase
VHPPSPDPGWDGKKPDPASSSAPYRLYNIGNNKPVRLLDFIAAIEKFSGKKINMIMKPLQPGDVQKTWADIDDLAKDYHFAPSTSVETGIRSFIEWYSNYYRAGR